MINKPKRSKYKLGIRKKLAHFSADRPNIVTEIVLEELFDDIRA